MVRFQSERGEQSSTHDLKLASRFRYCCRSFTSQPKSTYGLSGVLSMVSQRLPPASPYGSYADYVLVSGNILGTLFYFVAPILKGTYQLTGFMTQQTFFKYSVLQAILFKLTLTDKVIPRLQGGLASPIFYLKEDCCMCLVVWVRFELTVPALKGRCSAY